ncbi:hypothetical protein K1719_007213 [Acacia pycnantha]|nr:hypothetical protein K1719_007213 [Acacia pycnantha]
MRLGEEEKDLDGDQIEELGELDDIGDLNDIGRLEDIPLNQNVGETGEDDSDIDDDSFMAQSESESESSESEDNLDDDYEIHEDTEVSNEEEENLDYGGPVQERLGLRQLDGSERRPPLNNPHPGQKRRTPNPCASNQESSCSPSQQILQPPSTYTPPLATRSQQTSQTTKHSQSWNQSSKRTLVRNYGLGIMVDEDTGRSVYNLGLSSEKIPCLGQCTSSSEANEIES